MLQPNQRAPIFHLLGDDGHKYSLDSYIGNWVVVYFYPKDDTPGCTKEACVIRDIYSDFEKQDIVVFGISRDSVESHVTFKAKYELPFILLSDPEGETIESYDAQSAIGLTKRISYIINPEGFISKVYPNVDPANHAYELLEDITNALQDR